MAVEKPDKRNDGGINDGEDFALTWGNLETKYWGEMIGDGVQLRGKAQVKWVNWWSKVTEGKHGKTNDLTET